MLCTHNIHNVKKQTDSHVSMCKTLLPFQANTWIVLWPLLPPATSFKIHYSIIIRTRPGTVWASPSLSNLWYSQYVPYIYCSWTISWKEFRESKWGIIEVLFAYRDWGKRWTTSVWAASVPAKIHHPDTVKLVQSRVWIRQKLAQCK